MKAEILLIDGYSTILYNVMFDELQYNEVTHHNVYNGSIGDCKAKYKEPSCK